MLSEFISNLFGVYQTNLKIVLISLMFFFLLHFIQLFHWFHFLHWIGFVIIFLWLFSALCWCRGLGAVNKPTLLCCLKLWNMMGLSVTTHQLFHEQTMNFAIKLQRKYASSRKTYGYCVCTFSMGIFLVSRCKFLLENIWFWDDL